MGVKRLTQLNIFCVVLFMIIQATALAFAAPVVPPVIPTPGEPTNFFFTFRDIILPLANMGIGAIIAILLIWTIYPVINRNTETLREIATTLSVMSNNNLLLSQKLLEIIERQSYRMSGGV